MYAGDLRYALFRFMGSITVIAKDVEDRVLAGCPIAEVANVFEAGEV